jgi:fimbrial chaperone protein
MGAARSRLLRQLRAAACAFVVAFAAIPAFAASYAVEPTTFTLTPPVRNATMTLTNLSPVPIRLHVSAAAWSENDAGTMRLVPSPDIVIFPQLFTIPPLGKQVVRAAVVGAPREAEQPFRIVIDDMPGLDEIVQSGSARITMRTRFTVPVYVEPASPAAASHIENVGMHGGLLSFAVVNTGSTHVGGAALAVTGRDASGKTVYAAKVAGWHVLAGERRVFALAFGGGCLRSVTIAPDAGAVPAAQTVDLAACK